MILLLLSPDAAQRAALAVSAFTRVFAALWRCAAEPGSRLLAIGKNRVPVLRSSAWQGRRAASRPGHGCVDSAPPHRLTSPDDLAPCSFPHPRPHHLPRRGNRRRRRACGKHFACGRHHHRLARQFLHRQSHRAGSGADRGALRKPRRGLQGHSSRRDAAAAARCQAHGIASAIQRGCHPAHRASADVALLQLAAPLPASKAPAPLGAAAIPIQAGSRFTIAGVGVTRRGEGKSGGAIAPPTSPSPASPAPCRSASPIPHQQSSRRPRRLHRRFRRACFRDAGRPRRHRRRRELVHRPEQCVRLRRPHRRHAAHALSGVDIANGEGLGRGDLESSFDPINGPFRLEH